MPFLTLNQIESDIARSFPKVAMKSRKQRHWSNSGSRSRGIIFAPSAKRKKS